METNGLLCRLQGRLQVADRTQRDKLGYCVYYRAGYRWQVEHSETNKLLCRLQGRLETDDKETR